MKQNVISKQFVQRTTADDNKTFALTPKF